MYIVRNLLFLVFLLKITRSECMCYKFLSKYISRGTYNFETRLKLKFYKPSEKKTYATLYWQATPGMQPYTLGQQIRLFQKNQLNPKLHISSEIWILFRIFPNDYDNHRSLTSIDKNQNDQQKSVSEGFFSHNNNCTKCLKFVHSATFASTEASLFYCCCCVKSFSPGWLTLVDHFDSYLLPPNRGLSHSLYFRIASS